VARLSRSPSVYSPAAGGADSAETAAMAATLEAALTPEVKARVRREPALDAAAAVLAENFSDHGARTSRALSQWILWRSGSVAQYRAHGGGWAGRGGGSTLAGWATRDAEQLNASPEIPLAYGIARFTEGQRVSEEAVIGHAPFEVTTFAKTYAPGGPLTLALRPRAPFEELLFLLDAGDKIEEQALAPQADGSFFVSQSVPTRPGRYFIEIVGPAPRRATLLMVPIYVGVSEPTEPDEFLREPPPGPADPSGWSAWLRARIDAERAKLGKAPLLLDERLAAQAAERAAMVAARQPLPPNKASAYAAAAKDAGFATYTVTETRTTAAGTDALLLDLLRPWQRKRLIMTDRVLFGAAGVARSKAEGNVPGFTVVQEALIGSAEAPKTGAAKDEKAKE
jgi:hypothetical protein